MNTLFLANLLLIILSGLILVTGLYGLMGLCCKGSKLSRILGGVLGLVGLSTFVLTLIPNCF